MKRFAGIVIALCALPLAAQIELVHLAGGNRPPVDGPKGSLEGTVVNSVTGAPIKKAQVFINSMTGVSQSSAVTDLSGRFVARDLAPGGYMLSAAHDQFPNFGGRHGNPFSNVTLQPGERKTDVSIALTPGASLSGRVVDEAGDPMSNCSVQPMHFQQQGNKRMLAPAGGSQSDDRGEYRTYNLPPGRYFLEVNCQRQIPTGHPLSKMTEFRGPPPVEEVYEPAFYPSSETLAGAVQVNLAPGYETRGIDFQLRRVRAVTIRGKLEVPDSGGQETQNFNVQLIPKDPILANTFRRRGGGVNGNTRQFWIQGVTPGSYWLIANSFLPQGFTQMGRMSIDVGDTPLADLLVPLVNGVDIHGRVEMDENGAEAFKNTRVWLNPYEDGMGFGGQANVEVKEDGTFILPHVLPGTYELNCQLPNGHIKSLTFGEQDVHGRTLIVGPGTTGPLRIVVGTKAAHIEGTVSDVAGAAAGVMVALVPAGDAFLSNAPNSGVDSNGHFDLQNVAPGEYRLYAFQGADWGLTQNAALLKKLESRSESFRVSEGEQVSKQLSLIPASVIAEAEDALE